jgi:periplasmic protein TonB
MRAALEDMSVGEGHALLSANVFEPRPDLMLVAGGGLLLRPPAGFAVRSGPNWPVIVCIIGAHVALLLALVALDVIPIANAAKPAPLVVEMLALKPPPPPVPEKKVDQKVVVVTKITVPPAEVVTATPPPPITVTNVAPPPKAEVAPAPPPGPVSDGDLDSKMISATPPRYPEMSRRLHEQGTVYLSVLVGTDGTVADISVSRSSGSARLDKAALEAVRRWRWAPLMRNGAAVMVRGVVDIPFVLQG